MQPANSRKTKCFGVWTAGPWVQPQLGVCLKQPLPTLKLLSLAFHHLEWHCFFLGIWNTWQPSLTFSEHLLSPRHTTLSAIQKQLQLFCKVIIWLELLSPPFYRHRNQGWEKLNNLSKVEIVTPPGINSTALGLLFLVFDFVDYLQ